MVGIANNDELDFRSINTQSLGGSESEALMVSRPGTLDAALVRFRDTGEEIVS